MTSNRIFNSSSGGQIWVDQITPILSNPEGFPAPLPSIFVVPKNLSAINPEAYTPRVIGMGPYHHLRPDLYALEGAKLELAKVVLRGMIPPLEVQHLVAKLKELDSEIRASYNEYLDLSPDVLALIIAIDGLFLLAILDLGIDDSSGCYLHYLFSTLKMEDIYGDLFMLENQIPIYLLMGIFNRSDGDHYSSSFGAELDHQNMESGEKILLSPSILVAFCKQHCPLELDQLAGCWKHLLGFMYSSIVDSHQIEFAGPREVDGRAAIAITAVKSAAVMNTAKDAEEIVNCFATIFAAVPYGEQITGLLQKILQIIQGMPWDRIFLLFRKPNEEHAESKSQDVKIPSASQLSSVGVEINLAPKIGDIQFDEKGSFKKNKNKNKNKRNKKNKTKEKGPKPTLYLPLITLNVTSKVVLSNLVAYEASIALPRAKCELALYAFLMGGIIRAAEDVELLKAKGVVAVKGYLSNDEVADVFRGMCKPSQRPIRESNLEETIETVDKFYNSKWKVKACKFPRASGRVLKMVFEVLVIFAICLKLFCNTFDCPRISWKSPS